jgi:hypothetical protein
VSSQDLVLILDLEPVNKVARSELATIQSLLTPLEAALSAPPQPKVAPKAPAPKPQPKVSLA